MNMTPPHRRVITFYSYKGGVGRTMTMANVAYRLANKHGLRVIAVDWDLEAPGLHRFFGVTPKKAAKTPGVLDYFCEWRDAVKRGDPEPPDVRKWVLAIEDKEHAPKFGSLSLLTAGKLDEGYDGRLAELNWQDFYAQDAGASAVETLRAQLAGMADVVLIDSRTGFTDAGGICTIQIPDGVVLMTAPNQQSLEGIGRVARGISKASREARGGRDRARLWLVTSRVPMVEETYLAEQWFAGNEAWFTEGSRDGLWLKADHADGLKSHTIPHRGRWAFDEAVLNEASKVDYRDLLVAPYDRLTEMLFKWLREESPVGTETPENASTKTPDPGDIRAREEEIGDAELRGDILGMGVSTYQLAYQLVQAGRANEAIRNAEKACGIFLSRGSHVEHIRSLYILGLALRAADRDEEASKTLVKGLDLAREFRMRKGEAMFLSELADIAFDEGSPQEATQLITQAYLLLRELDEAEVTSGDFWRFGNSFAQFELSQKAIEAMRHSARVARKRSNHANEARALESLLMLYDIGESLSDVGALRSRLDELKPTPLAVPKRRRPAGSA